MTATAPTEDRPRVFAWVRARNASGRGRDPQPQVIFADPRVGCEGMEIVAEYPLDGADRRSLDELSQVFPIPPIERLKVEA